MIIGKLIKLPALLLGIFLLAGGCQGQGNHLAAGKTGQDQTGQLGEPSSTYIDGGDLAAIKKHGYLRILTRRLDRLPRKGSALEREWQLVSQFAACVGL